jgi:galactose mutarotase-like enzyme
MNISIQNNFLKATINTKGAELNSLVKIADEKEYIWEGNPVFWGKHSPVLFPIIGTLKNNCYFYENQNYELTRHGFARDMEFEIVEKLESSVTFSLKSFELTLQIYPFSFELQLTYSLIENELKIGYSIHNLNKVEMPFSIGAHPAFALPNEIENYSLSFEKQEDLKCYLLENDLLSNANYIISLENKELPITNKLFEKDALIFKQLQSKKVSILENGKAILKVSFEDFKSLGIWSKVGAQFVCIEPWLGYSDTTETSGNIAEKEAILILEPNKKHDCSFTIEIL